MLLVIAAIALAQFAIFYWRAIVTGVASQPVSEQVLDAASLHAGTFRGEDFRTLAKLLELTPALSSTADSLGFVPLYFKIIHTIGNIAAGRFSAVADWAESEQILCARYAAVQIDRRLQANLAQTASIRSS